MRRVVITLVCASALFAASLLGRSSSDAGIVQEEIPEHLRPTGFVEVAFRSYEEVLNGDVGVWTSARLYDSAPLAAADFALYGDFLVAVWAHTVELRPISFPPAGEAVMALAGRRESPEWPQVEVVVLSGRFIVTYSVSSEDPATDVLQIAQAVVATLPADPEIAVAQGGLLALLPDLTQMPPGYSLEHENYIDREELVRQRAAQMATAEADAAATAIAVTASAQAVVAATTTAAAGPGATATARREAELRPTPTLLPTATTGADTSFRTIVVSLLIVHPDYEHQALDDQCTGAGTLWLIRPGATTAWIGDGKGSLLAEAPVSDGTVVLGTGGQHMCQFELRFEGVPLLSSYTLHVGSVVTHPFSASRTTDLTWHILVKLSG